MMAAGGGDAFFSGALLGIVTGILTGPVLRSWLVWRSRSDASERADEAAGIDDPLRSRRAANGRATPKRSSGRPIS
jgi:Na+/glutamate symporter